MSSPMLPQVQAASQAHGFTYCVLRELAFHHNETFGYAYPSLERLADRLHVCVRTIQRHILKLEKMGELIVERVHGRGLNNRYYLAVCGIFPKAENKHDRWRRVKDALNRVWLRVAEENPTAPRSDTEQFNRQTAPTYQNYPQRRRCGWGGCPELVGDHPNFCDFHADY